jgi:ankyrin repeat protein
LSTATIDKLETEHDGIVIYFYFSFREEATQNVTNFKHSLLMQLVRQLVREDETRRDYFYVPKVFQKLFDKYSHSQDPLDEHVDATMEGLLNESKHTYIIVDALDEFLNQTPLTTGNRGKVIKFLEGLCRTSHGGTHILVTSRRENDIETAVKEIEVPKNIVLMDTKEINIDIKTFLMISLREHPYKEWTGKLKKLVAKTLTSKADGVFRWAALQLLGLRDKDRERDVETALQDLPEDLEETYKVMLTRIENSKRSDMALSILRWLAYSQRSILLSEMSEIAIFEMEACVSADVDDYTVSYHPKDRFSSIWMTRKILSGLVTVSGVDDRDEVPQDQDGTVSFSHFTVQEYLQGKNVSPTKFRLEESTGHWYIMRSCLGYIKSYDEVYGESRTQQQADKGNKVGSTQEALDSNHDSDADSEFDFSDSETPETGIIDYRPFPLLLYAAKYWWLHAVAFCNSGGVTSVSDRVGKVATAIDELQGQAFKSTAKVALAVASSDSDSEKEDSTSNRIWFPMRQPATDKVSFEIKDSDRGEATFLLVDCLDTYLSKCESWKTQKVNAFDFESPLALRHMSGVGDGTIVQLLLDAGVDVSYKTSDGEAALHRAVRKNHKRIVEQLVERKAKLNPTDGERRTPLSWAAGDGLTDIAAYLIDKGARIDPDDADKSHLGGKAPEVRSAIRPFAVLSNIYVWVADRPGKGWTALHWALHNEQQETAILLVEQGADILDTDWWGPCPLSIAIVKRQRAVLRAMILKDKEACKMGTFGNQWTALHLAAAYRDLPVMQLLLPEAADVTLRDKSGCTAMEIAAVGAHALGMETMLQGRHSQFWNPEMGRAEDAIKLLLSHGGSVDPGGELCSTPLHYASMHGQLEAAETLLECGVSVHVRNKFDWTPLLNAAVYGHTPVARLLLSKGAEVNATTDKGLSALILASANGHVETVRLLLEDGADTSLREQNGKTALEVAKQLEKDDVVRLLSSSGSDVVPSLESDLEVENKEPNSDNSVDDFAQ